jgi:hypothetical protein
MTLNERIASIDGLTGRVHSAAMLSDLLARNALPQVAPAAFVLPLGFRCSKPDVSAGLYRQSIEHLVGVLLVVRSASDATGAAGLVDLDPLIKAVIEKVAGWVPGEDAIGEYFCVRGELVGMPAGTLLYQLDFAIEDQLRITT